MEKTQSKNTHFFRVLVAYQFGKLASMMRANLETPDRGIIPINIYALNLAISGTGKGYSMNIFDEILIEGFRERFLTTIFPTIAETRINKIAAQRAARDNVEVKDWKERLHAEFTQLGTLAFSFDSATDAAVKQMRQKLLLANAGSMNLEIDEISANFTGNMDVLASYLELYDKGFIKQKLLKNTRENTRTEELHGSTPTNLMLFGTPTKLLDGSKVEDDFIDMLSMGYARRLLVGFSTDTQHNVHVNEEDLYRALTDRKLQATVARVKAKFSELANMANFNRAITVDKTTALVYLKYKLECEAKAVKMPAHEETRKAEMAHRYFKALKLAGAYAFIDQSAKLTVDHMNHAIKLVDDCGEQFVGLLNKEGSYAKIARYIASVGRPLTHVDLIENVPSFRGSKSDKAELLDLAAAYGHQNNLVIKREQINGIEFVSGEPLELTDLKKLTVSYSTEMTTNYVSATVPYAKLHQLICQTGFNYCAHHFDKGYRHHESVIPGFNLIILDIDDGLQLSTAQILLKEYMAMFATTKRHTKEHNRFRIIMPMTHTLKLTTDDFLKFMENVFNWLPFPVDSAAKDISRKWLSNTCKPIYQAGKLLDATMFIPSTSQANNLTKQILDAKSMTKLEAWFAREITVGNRNGMLLRYGLSVLDSTSDFIKAIDAVQLLNSKLKNPLEADELKNTVCRTLANRKV